MVYLVVVVEDPDKIDDEDEKVEVDEVFDHVFVSMVELFLPEDVEDLFADDC